MDFGQFKNSLKIEFHNALWQYFYKQIIALATMD